MRDWAWLLFWLGWFIVTSDISFSFLLGEKNQVVIEKVNKEEPKKETNEIKADW